MFVSPRFNLTAGQSGLFVLAPTSRESIHAVTADTGRQTKTGDFRLRSPNPDAMMRISPQA
jgi:hypothetical protein